MATEDNIQGAPDIGVEILSEFTRKIDEVTKRKLYERFGVQEYWLVDPELELVKTFKLARQKYGHATELSKENSPGFNLLSNRRWGATLRVGWPQI